MFMKSEDAELVAAELILVATAQATEEAAAVTVEAAPVAAKGGVEAVPAAATPSSNPSLSVVLFLYVCISVIIKILLDK